VLCIQNKLTVKMGEPYNAYQGGYVAQPGVVQTVIIEQPGNLTFYPQNIRDWESGMCACADDCGICCWVWWCPCVETCRIAEALDEGHRCCLCYHALLRSHTCLPSLRTKTRAAMGIKGDACQDTFSSYCCPGPVMCQISRQLKAAGKR